VKRKDAIVIADPGKRKQKPGCNPKWRKNLVKQSTSKTYALTFKFVKSEGRKARGNPDSRSAYFVIPENWTAAWKSHVATLLAVDEVGGNLHGFRRFGRLDEPKA
jgi:hypothetical protein